MQFAFCELLNNKMLLTENVFLIKKNILNYSMM